MKFWKYKSAKKTFINPVIVGMMALGFFLFSAPAFSTLLPDGFFDRLPKISSKQISISADYLSQTSQGNVSAIGQVDISYLGYFATADRLEFNQKSKNLTLIGNVVIRDPDGVEYKTNRIDLTDSFKQAILDEMIMITSDGAKVTSTKTDYSQDGVTILTKGTYAPCGDCIDEKGRKIGWSIRTKSITYDRGGELLDLEQPVLEILGVPVAWFPWLRLPDPSNPRANGFRLPRYFYSENIGLKLEFPYFHAAGKDTDFIIVPTVTTNQGPLFNASMVHRFSDWGQIDITVSGLYQFTKSKFAGTVGFKDWRGAVQTSGDFTPAENWKVGWAYTTFTDRAYLSDYNISSRRSATNEIYAQYLDKNIYTNVRFQEFVMLGNYDQAAQNKQASALPNARYEKVVDLENDGGRISLSANLLGINRVADSTTTANGVPYTFGYAGKKINGTLEAGWSKQFENSLGFVFTPYLGVRADSAYYDGGSLLNPIAGSNFNLTPIAAIDVRYPIMAADGKSTYLIEPIAQFVYRGSNVSNVGITNDNAQSLIFDDAKLFSFNRFSGSDRQETGLRANVGVRYQADFADGSYLSFLIGQSFQISGVNSLAIGDAAQIGTNTGLGNVSSDIVLGLQASPFEGANFGTKMVIDPNDSSIERATAIASIAYEGWSLSTDYSYIAADPLLGSIIDQQSIGGSLKVPFDEYWYGKAAAGWNLISNSMINHSATIGYDDGYFAVSGHYTGSGDVFDPTNQTYRVTFKLKGPDGTGYGL